MLHIDYKLEYTHEEMVEFVKEEIKKTEKLMKYNFNKVKSSKAVLSSNVITIFSILSLLL